MSGTFSLSSRAVLSGLLALLIWATGVASAAAGLVADVATSQEKGFGRIVITFKDRQLLPQYVAKVANGILVLQFAEPVEARMDRVPTDLAAYVVVARRDPDGQALRLALQRQVRINTMEAGERLFIDLLPPTWTGAMPPLPEAVVQDLAKRAEAAMKAAREADSLRFGVRVMPKLDLRVGRLPTFTRFSFSWNVPYDTQMSRDGDKVRIAFNRMSLTDFASVLADAPPGLKELTAEADGDKLTVVMTVAPEAEVRGFRDDQTYVVDLSLPGRASDKAVIKLSGDPPAVPKSGKEKVELPGATPTEVAGKGAAAQPVKISQAPLPAEDETAPAAPADKPAEAADAAGSGELPPELRDTGPVVQTSVRVEAKRIGSVVRVTFPFRDKVASAAFKRQDTLFVVFDTKLPLEVQALRATLGPTARDVAAGPLKDGQLLRIQLADPQLTTLGNDGNSWILTIGELVLEPTRPLKVQRLVKGDGKGSVKIDLAEAGLVHQFTDPAVGDTLVVITAPAPARGAVKSYQFAELDVLTSAHGIAVAAKVDDLKATVDAQGVTLGREDGLSLSTTLLGPGKIELPKTQRKTRRITIEGSGFLTRDPTEFALKQNELQQAVIDAPELQRTQARARLAQFYLAHRFAPEAMGMLRRASDEEPAIQRDPGFVVLYAAAQTLTGRLEAGRQALMRTEVSESADAAFWRVIASAGLGQWDEARAAAGKATGAIGSYPPDIQAMFYLAAGQAEVELGEAAKAQGYLAAIEPTDVSQDVAAHYEILQGRLADAAGRPDDALQRYDRATATNDRQASAEAEYRRLRQLVRDSKIEPEEAIKRLQSLAFSWRGDEIELKTLRFLGGLQAKAGHWRDAFSSMRSAVLVGPEAETTRLFQDEMGREFTSLYLDGKADALDPIEALTLYYDFRDLTPPGRMGDEIVRKLADRLVAVDLLDQAAELLTHQVDNRLHGAARAQIAADLAVVHLLDRKPDRALAVLNKTRQSGLSNSVERQRRIVEARALAESGRTELAMELTQPLSGNDADRLRADIMWKAKRWKEAGEGVETMLGGRWADQAPLDDLDRQDVLRGAVAFALANDQAGLDRFRGKFMAKMAAGPSAKAFDVVTQPIQSMGEDFRSVAKTLATIDTMRAFVDEYRNQYLKTKPEATPEAGKGGDGKAGAKAAPAKPQVKAPADQPSKVALNDTKPPAKAEAPAGKEPAKADAKPAAH